MREVARSRIDTASLRLARSPLIAQCALIFVISILTRGAYIAVVRPYRVPQHVELDYLAINLAKGEGFANPFPTPTGPSAWCPPLYPLALSLLYRFLGAGSAGELGKYAFNIAGVSLGYSALPWVALQLGLPQAAGLAAGLFGAAIPLHMWREFRGADITWTGLAVMLQAALITRLWKRRRPTGVSVALQGAAWGATLLTSAATGSILLGWLVATLAQPRWPWPKRIRYSVVLLFWTVAVLCPWIVRNHWTFGRFVPLRSNFGLELRVSNNPYAHPSEAQNLRYGVHGRYHPFFNRSERETVRLLGEVRYGEEKLRMALDWIVQRPATFFRLSLQRAILFWFPPVRRPMQAVVLWPLTVLALLGFWRLRKADPSSAWLIGSMWFFYPLIYYVVQAEVRYRYAIYWSLLLMAAYLIVTGRLFDRVRSHLEGSSCVVRLPSA